MNQRSMIDLTNEKKGLEIAGDFFLNKEKSAEKS